MYRNVSGRDVAAGMQGGVTWYENDGLGWFTPHVLYWGSNDGSQANLYYIALPVDLDRDGDKDLIIDNTADGVMSTH